MKRAITAPVLHLHGELDGNISQKSARGAEDHVNGQYQWMLINGVGHFPHEENPAEFSSILLQWLKANYK
jgi:pimeloyl-ACP methyl ester carboxylesterase